VNELVVYQGCQGRASKSYVYYMGLTSRSNSAGGGLPGGCRGDLLVSLSICTELVKFD
jgi:hypothetical protein